MGEKGIFTFLLGWWNRWWNKPTPTPEPQPEPEPNPPSNPDNGGMGMRKAVCIGINDYHGTQNDLYGCVNDAHEWKKYLLDDKDYDDVVLLLDSQATIQNVKAAIKKLIAEANSGDVIAVTYSGHGSKTNDRNGDEPDGKDEASSITPMSII